MNGVINIYKPEGISSFDVVRQIRKLSNTKKVGHTGTLDPLATGVLPICIGKGTKIVDYILSKDKTYKAELMLGIITDTYDREGSILENNEVILSEDKISEVIYSFIGESMQIPPMFSAIKINGKKLYELARQGITVPRKERKVILSSIVINKIDLPKVSITVNCSKGTYIRSLCYDIGKALGCGCTMWNLERTSTGMFSVEDSIPLSSINSENINNYIISIEKALIDYKKVCFSSEFEKALLNGVTIVSNPILDELNIDELYRVYFEDNSFIGLGKMTEKGFKMENLLI
jgi:tRNA pseudouridine55 synthase